ncbi:MAG: ATP-binding protein [Myxococcota bacterium]
MSAEAVLLEVEDTGPGIPLEERERVLDRFYRVLGSGMEGSGLGLAIVSRIVGLLGAKLELLEGRSGRGLRVLVHFPIKLET